jgi:hypothetical protein
MSALEWCYRHFENKNAGTPICALRFALSLSLPKS